LDEDVAPVNYSDNLNVGTANASATYAGDSNHEGSSGNSSFSISKASSTTVVTCPASPQTYTGAAITPCTAHVTGVGGLDEEVTPVNYSDNVNVGTAGASATYAGDSNHEGSNGNSSFSISKAASTTVVTCPGTPQTYTGAAITPCTAHVTGVG